MTIDEWCNCSICARRRQLKKIRNQWNETLIRPESTPEEGQSSDPLTEEDHEAAAFVLFNQLYGLLSLKAAPGGRTQKPCCGTPSTRGKRSRMRWTAIARPMAGCRTTTGICLC